MQRRLCMIKSYCCKGCDFTCAALAQQIPYTKERLLLKLHLADLGDIKLFNAYGTDHVMVDKVRYEHSIVVQADRVHCDWEARFDTLSEAHFDYLQALKPDVLLLGTGMQQRFAQPSLYRALTASGVGVECMSTPAACRTYNFLVAEGRRVVAAILP